MTKNFLQSEEWRKFQEATGKRTFRVGEMNIIEHKLPIVGKYFYIPRWPNKYQVSSIKYQVFFDELIDLAKKEKAGWIRIDLNDSHSLALIRANRRLIKAPHDMQPREIFVIDITKSEEVLLSEMKPKTRYNINLAKKRGVSVQVISNFQFLRPRRIRLGRIISNKIPNSNDKIIERFIELVDLTAKRKGVNFHPGEYYRKMIETIPENMLKLYCAEYDNKIIAANLMIFYGNTATYLHGASCDECRNVMAPYLLQWQAMKDAKKMGCEKYDFGGVKICHSERSEESRDSSRGAQNDSRNNWSGITKFKLGFSPNTKPVVFPGSYDIIINPLRYWAYRVAQKIKSFGR